MSSSDNCCVRVLEFDNYYSLNFQCSNLALRNRSNGSSSINEYSRTGHSSCSLVVIVVCSGSYSSNGSSYSRDHSCMSKKYFLHVFEYETLITSKTKLFSIIE